MRRILTATALTLLTAPAFAGVIDERKPFPPEGYQMAPGDCRGGVGSMLQETSDGLYNCPAAAWENTAGDVIAFTIAAGLILNAAGVDVAKELGNLKPF